ncbi:DUF2268 domain-containing putative Zn-dependent protease [uncultured Exiguobacterium sp.]|uniref:DUF2268 domain-containing protein n=1 Tax=uncultured Exiguobacterium sp. TaxID=202669 RepID=UPI0025D8B1A0|nr:DUF2268 domain-containing putative Zn-dependent protease [uncultured Exiguobacterium sp.]
MSQSTQPTEKPKSTIREVELAKDQHAKIITLYPAYIDYITKVQKKMKDTNVTDEDLQQIFDKTVRRELDRIQKEQDIFLDFKGFKEVFTATSYLNDLKRLTKRLMNEEKENMKSVHEALQKSADHLPGKDKIILMLPLSEEHRYAAKATSGLMGFAMSDGSMVIMLGEEYTHEILKYVVAHEYNHSIVNEHPEIRQPSSIDYLIFEGKAEVFAQELYPKAPLIKTEQIAASDKKKILEQVKNNSLSYDELSIGNEVKEIPRLTIYSLGTELMADFRQKKYGQTLQEFSLTPVSDVIHEGKFKSVLE